MHPIKTWNKSMPLISEGGLYDMPMADYHSDPCHEPSVSRSFIFDCLNESPLHAAMRHPRIGGKKDGESTPEASIGTVAHDLLLQGEGAFAICPFDDYRTNAAKDWKAQTIAQGKTPIKAAPFAAAVKAANEELQYCHDELKGKLSHYIGYGGMTYSDLELLIKAAQAADAMQHILDESIKNCDDLCDEINKLRAENERLTGKLCQANVVICNYERSAAGHEAEVERLEERVKELESLSDDLFDEYKKLQSAQVVEVTVDEFSDAMVRDLRPDKAAQWLLDAYARGIATRHAIGIMEKYPNGLRIVPEKGG